MLGNPASYAGERGQIKEIKYVRNMRLIYSGQACYVLVVGPILLSG